MTIFRRHTNSLTDSAPILEALTSSSAYLLADFDDKDNVVVGSCLDNTNSTDNAPSVASATSNSTVPFVADDNNSTGTLVSSEASTAAAVADEEALAQAFLEDFQVKLDPKEDTIQVSMEVPEGIPVEDLTVQVDDDCILRVSGEVARPDEPPSNSNSSSSGGALDGSTSIDDSTTTSGSCLPLMVVEQAFQLDEQSLDIRKIEANLSSDGILTITAPKKDEEDVTLLEQLPLQTNEPPAKVSAEYLQVILDLPGVHESDMHVSYANGKLRVSASRHFGRVRSFKRTFPIDTQQFDANRMKAYLSKGRLTMQVPPKAKQQDGSSGSRTIEITSPTARSASITVV